jgi:hypothetical protein
MISSASEWRERFGALMSLHGLCEDFAACSRSPAAFFQDSFQRFRPVEESQPFAHDPRACTIPWESLDSHERFGRRGTALRASTARVYPRTRALRSNCGWQCLGEPDKPLKAKCAEGNPQGNLRVRGDDGNRSRGRIPAPSVEDMSRTCAHTLDDAAGFTPPLRSGRAGAGNSDGGDELQNLERARRSSS